MVKENIQQATPALQEQQSVTTTETNLNTESQVFEKQNHQPKIPGEIEQGDNNIVVETKKTSNIGGIINMFKGYIGSGVLALPYVFNEAGYLYGAIFICILGLVVYYTNCLLLKVGERILKKGESYIDVCDRVLDYRVAFFMRICFIVGALSGCISYVIFFVEFFGHAIGDKLSDFVYLLFALCIILPMSLINDFTKFVKYSFLANILLFIAIATMYGQNFIDIFTDTDSEQGAWQQNSGNLINIERAPLMIGVGLYAFDAIYFILSIRDSLEKPQQFTSRVLNVTNIIVALLYLTFGFTGVWANGHEMEEIYLFTLPENTYVKFLQCLYAVSLAFSYPLFLHAACDIMEKKDNPVGRKINAGENKNAIIAKRTLFRTFITLLVLVIAFLIPRFAIALNLFGSISGASLQFFLPLYSYYSVFKDEMSTKLKVFNYTILAVGLGGCILGIYGSIAELVNPE